MIRAIILSAALIAIPAGAALANHRPHHATSETVRFDARDVRRLLAAPTDANCEAFDAKYGDGSAAIVLSR